MGECGGKAVAMEEGGKGVNLEDDRVKREEEAIGGRRKERGRW